MRKRYLLRGCLIALVLTLPTHAIAQMNPSEATDEVERQLRHMAAQGRIEDVKIIQSQTDAVIAQVKSGDVNLQAILDAQAGNLSRPQSSERPSPPQISRATGSVPSDNIPKAAYIVSERKWVGFPAQLVTSTTTALEFSGGKFVSCANWDPSEFEISAESVERIKGCKITSFRPKGKRAKAFKKGQRIDVSFGNVGGLGSDLGDTSASQIEGANLRMMRDGRIAIGRFRSTTLTSDISVGYSGKRRALLGRYELDGNLIKIVTDNGETIHGFAAWSSNSGGSKIDHIYINGEQFWDRK